MKDVKAMTPRELELSRIELTAIVARTAESKMLAAVKAEIAERKKFSWKPWAEATHNRTGQMLGEMIKFGSPISWEIKPRTQKAMVIKAYTIKPII
jgi:hypothetical protein